MSKRKPLTEEQWLAESSCYLLLKYLQQHQRIAKKIGGKRKLRLLSVGMCRSVWHLITNEDCRRTIEVGERAADGKATRIEVRAAAEIANALAIAAADGMRVLSARGIHLRSNHPEVETLNCAQSMASAAAYTVSQQGGVLGLQIVSQNIAQLRIREAGINDMEVHANLIRDVYGNPFRTVVFDPRWRTSTVLDLARLIYDERGWERMPILADALMDAGCDSDDIIQHCHGPGPHTRGCWVVDAILGKS